MYLSLLLYILDLSFPLFHQDRMIIDAFNSERITYDELGKRLGVSLTHAWRLRGAAYDNLEQLLLMHGTIRKYLRLDDDR